MKKLFILLISIILFSSCKQDLNYVATLTYRIYYSNDNIVEKKYVTESTEHPTYCLTSYRGSNYLYVNRIGTWFTGNGMEIEGTSAPIEVISFKLSEK